jgi:two-component system chemotaxis sensor kinase CheA
MGEMDDLIKEFLVESYENLDRLDQEFLALEQDPGNREHLGGIFRTIHTIKGTSGFFGFVRLQALTHVGENLLSKLRDGSLALTPDMADALLAMVDAVRQMLGGIESTGMEAATSHEPLIARLTALLEPPASSTDRTAIDTPDEETPPGPGEAAAPGSLTAMFEAANRASHPPEDPVQIPVTSQHHPDTGPVARTEAVQRDEPRSEAHGPALADTTIRVDVELLDRLMNLVGELVLARNQILQYSGTRQDQGFLATSQRLNLLTSELQEGVMKTRMQPIGNLWSKFPRVVRDLAQACGKQVRIEMEGKETELDKTLIEAIKDPLTHIVRNSVDHGIEPAAKRLAAGKPAEGTLALRAYHEGGQVIIEINDDGGGINAARVKAKAVEKGLIGADEAERLDERGVLGLIFLPGFSTAEKVTNISGRGVGMDVVKTNIERIGGHVDVQSRPGQGTSLTIKIPLTLAIIPALIVTSGGERFAIPQVSLLELVRLNAAAESGHENVYGSPVYRLRGQLLPLVYLNRELRMPEPPAGGAVNIVVLQADDQRFGLVVDAVNDAEEIVVKPLGKALKGLQVFAGATIMGDGRVALILDVLGMGKRANALAKSTKGALDDRAHAAAAQDDRQALLIFTSPDDGRMAIPLSKVSRLEEFKRQAVERAGATEVMQYRGEILPLVHVFQRLPERRKEPRNPDCGVPGDILQVVIHNHGGRQVGLVVGRILDTVEAPLRLQRAASREGVLGCLVIQERITELLDVEGVVRSALPNFYEGLQPAGT